MPEYQDQITNAKLAIYLMMYSLIKITPAYFSTDVYRVIALNEKDMIKQIQELDEGVTVNDLLVSLFEKERMH